MHMLKFYLSNQSAELRVVIHKTMIIRKLKIRILIMVFAIYLPFCFIGDGINLDYFDISTPEKVCKQTFIIKITLY